MSHPPPSYEAATKYGDGVPSRSAADGPTPTTGPKPKKSAVFRVVQAVANFLTGGRTKKTEDSAMIAPARPRDPVQEKLHNTVSYYGLDETPRDSRATFGPYLPEKAGESSTMMGSSSGATHSSQMHIDDQNEANYVRIKRTSPHTPIVGSWRINTSLYIPENLLVRLKNPSEERHHIYLWSEEAMVDACVRLTGGEGKALITASTQTRLSLRIIRETSHNIVAFCRALDIRVYIPRTFKGTVRAKTANGSISYSPAIAEQIVTVYEKETDSRHCIGLVNTSTSEPRAGLTPTEDLLGLDTPEPISPKPQHDQLRLDAKSRDGQRLGNIYIAYEDED